MPKLPNGMFCRKGRPGWYIRLYRSGRERWVSLGTEYGAACDKARALSAGIEVAPRSTGTVETAAAQWLESYLRTQRSEKGQKQAAQRVRDFFVPYLGQMELERVTGEDVRAFRLWLEKNTSLSPTTVGNVLSDLRCFLNWCESARLVKHSPFPKRIMPRIQEQLPDRLTDEEAAEVAALPEPHGFVCRLAMGTGMRWGELCRCQAADVKRVRVPGQAEELWFIEVSQTKSKRVRRIPLSSELVAEVRTRVGRLVPYASHSPGSFANRVRRRTSVAGFHVHQMRHTFACQWLERGGSLPALQQMLGHASIEMTQRYGRLTDDAVLREARRLQDAAHG